MSGLIVFIICFECVLSQDVITRTQRAYKIDKGTTFTAIIQTSLSPNLDSRGDTFSAELKEPFTSYNNVILSADVETRGVCKKRAKMQ